MRYAKIREMDISNGDGLSTSLFMQGCNHRCENCFNPETWDFNDGKIFTTQLQDTFVELSKKIYINHIALLGGEPLSQPYNEFYDYVKRLKQETNKPIWLWSGYTYDHIINSPKKEILNYIDVLIDGKYVDGLKDLNLKYCGSSNQRVIDVQQSLLENKVVLYTK